MERQLGEAKKSLAEANRDGQSAAARIRALHAELEEVRIDVMLFSKMSTYMTLVCVLCCCVARLDVGPEGEEPEREGGGGGSRVAEAAWEAEGGGGKHFGLNSFDSFFLFIGPESDHWQCLSVTDSLTP